MQSIQSIKAPDPEGWIMYEAHDKGVFPACTSQLLEVITRRGDRMIVDYLSSVSWATGATEPMHGHIPLPPDTEVIKYRLHLPKDEAQAPVRERMGEIKKEQALKAEKVKLKLEIAVKLAAADIAAGAYATQSSEIISLRNTDTARKLVDVSEMHAEWDD